jgi:tetratricopeptide (TPR) repeat protein
MPQAVKILVFSYIRLNNYEIAQSLIEEALDKYFQDLQLQNMLAYILYEEQDYRQCLKVYRDVLKKDRENVTALNGMGYCLIEHLARYEEGLDFCLQALKKSPEDPSILDSVGWGYFKMGQYKEAELYLKQAFELMPENPIIKKHVTMAVEAS